MVSSKQKLALIVFLLVVPSAHGGGADFSPNMEILKKICSGQCSGFGAGIKFLADKSGMVKYYRFDGSIQSCSHPPSVIYDLKGDEKDVMGSNPVDPKNIAQARAIQKWQRLQKDLTATKIIWCNDL